MNDECGIDTGHFAPTSEMVGDSEEDTALLKGMADEATSFITSQHWCRAVRNQFFGYGVGGVVAVFLCLIEPNVEDVDGCLWVIVGDLPPAYIITEDNPDPASALEAYIEEMFAWVEAAAKGESTEDCIPVSVPATKEYAEQLRNRLEFLRDNLLPSMRAVQA